VHPDGPVVLAAQLHSDGYSLALASLGGALGPVRDEPLAAADIADPERALRQLARAGAELVRASGRRCVGVGLAAPSPVTEPDRRAVGSGVLDWASGTPLGALWDAAVAQAGLVDALATADGVAGVANDANHAALAEHRHGAGRDAGHLLYVTTGHRGIGGALVLDGRLYAGAGGLALEIGQLTVDPEGVACPCGRRGCFEAEAGPDALLRAAGLRADAPLHRLDGVFAAAAEGEPAARDAVRHVAERLGRGLAMVIDVLNPDRVVLGAFLSQVLRGAGELVSEVVADRSLWGKRASAVPIVPAALVRPELAGAGELGWAPVLADPERLRAVR
jgi:predicted NBD/HSP70 family sugar kinase